MQNQHLKDTYLVEVCHRFLERQKPAEIAAWLGSKLKKKVSRESIYPLIQEAIRRGFFVLRPPLEDLLGQRLADRYFKGAHKDRFHVASASAEAARDWLPARAVDLIMDLIWQVVPARTAAGKTRVRIGLAGGGTIMRVAQALAARLREENKLPRLGIHALSSGFRLKRPLTAPITFLSYFDQVPTEIDYVGLFAPAVVAAEDYDRVITLPGVKESFDRAKTIDIVVTGLASADDKHGELNQFMKMAGEQTKGARKARNKRAVGDLQYQSYSNEGPITDLRPSVRTVSLFDLESLRTFAARKDKFVVVVAGPCGTCKKTKVNALRPLLQSPSLKVWTHLVLDAQTAQELLD